MDKKCRKEMVDLICSTWDMLEGGNATVNSTAFLERTKKMSDAEFDSYITSILYDPKKKKHLYFEIELFENEPRFQEVEKAAANVGAVLFDYVARPDLATRDGKPVITTQKVFCVPINMRRVQQMLNKKNNIPTDIDNRNPKTGQVTNKSKAARVSDTEMFGMVCHGVPNLLYEYFGPKGGNTVQEQDMQYQIATTGNYSLDLAPQDRANKVALNTANVMLLGAGLESNLINANGMLLTRTIEHQYKDARTLSRGKLEV